MFLKLRKNFLDISHVQAVIFDMDGTLVESEHIWTQAKQDVARNCGVNVADDMLKRYVGRGLNDFIDDVLHPMTLKYRAELNIEMQEKALTDYGSRISVIRGAIDILTAFSSAGIRVAICSSGSLQAINCSLEVLNAIELVEIVVSGDTLRTGKPHPLPYLKTLDKLNLDAKNTIAFEDTIAGLTAATTAGIQTMIVGQKLDDPIFSNATLIDPHLENFELLGRV